MKRRHFLHLLCPVTTALASVLPAQTPPPANPSRGPAAPLVSDVFAWGQLTVTPTAKGVRRAVFDGPTATVDKLHCHITTRAHARAAQHAQSGAASFNTRQAHRALHAQKKSFGAINRVDRPVRLASAWFITINHAQGRSAIAPAEHAANGIDYQSFNVGAPAGGQHISVFFS